MRLFSVVSIKELSESPLEGETWSDSYDTLYIALVLKLKLRELANMI